MDNLKKIIELMKRNDCDNQKLAAFLGLNRQAITDWKAGRSKSYKKYLPQIADFFNVSVNYLLGKEDSQPTTSVDENKKELFGHIDQMTDEQLEQLKSYAKFLIDNKK